MSPCWWWCRFGPFSLSDVLVSLCKDVSLVVLPPHSDVLLCVVSPQLWVETVTRVDAALCDSLTRTHLRFLYEKAGKG